MYPWAVEDVECLCVAGPGWVIALPSSPAEGAEADLRLTRSPLEELSLGRVL